MPRGMRAPEPDPLPFEEIHEHDEIESKYTSADGHSAHGYFTIPEGADGKALRHLFALPGGGTTGAA